MLNVIDVSKRYGKVLANDHVSFEAPSGEITVLAGPNGAGKSTVIKSIAGLLRFDGEITIEGHKNKTLEAKAALGYVPETPALYDLLTVGEHLEFIARAYKLTDYNQRIDELLTRFELAEKKAELAKTLSKGMQQKLSICCALLIEPKVILFDEPLVGLDPHAIKELKEVFRELRDRGTAVLVSTHMLDSVEGVWDRVLIMMHGKVVAMRRREDEDQGENLEELFFRITEGSGA